MMRPIPAILRTNLAILHDILLATLLAELFDILLSGV